jgi:integrase
LPTRKTPAAKDADRFIVERGGLYHYKRRVPAVVADLDDRAPHVRVSLKTRDLALARQKRDALEAADDALWNGLLSGEPDEVAQLRHREAIKRSEAMGFPYRPLGNVVPRERVPDLVERLEAIEDERTPRQAERAVLGLIDPPRVSVSSAFKRYREEIAPARLIGKSDEQKRQWLKTVRRSINNFIDINGDLPMYDIAREHALKMHAFWAVRVAPAEGRATHSASSGNRDLGDFRAFYRDFYRHIGQRDRPNPFADLSFSEPQRATRPPIATDFIRDKILARGALDTLNAEARRIILVMIETGMRPSEICNLTADAIKLKAPIPHVLVEPRDDPDDPRQVKTKASIRMIPLLGVALAALKLQPDGFPRYRNKESGLSAAVNKRMRKLGLFPTRAHSVYSLRHSFEDRMKEGRVDVELRMILMGHTIDRPEYGSGGSLKLRRDALRRITLPYDQASV